MRDVRKAVLQQRWDTAAMAANEAAELGINNREMKSVSAGIALQNEVKNVKNVSGSCPRRPFAEPLCCRFGAAHTRRGPASRPGNRVYTIYSTEGRFRGVNHPPRPTRGRRNAPSPMDLWRLCFLGSAVESRRNAPSPMDLWRLCFVGIPRRCLLGDLRRQGLHPCWSGGLECGERVQICFPGRSSDTGECVSPA